MKRGFILEGVRRMKNVKALAVLLAVLSLTAACQGRRTAAALETASGDAGERAAASAAPPERMPDREEADSAEDAHIPAAPLKPMEAEPSAFAGMRAAAPYTRIGTEWLEELMEPVNDGKLKKEIASLLSQADLWDATFSEPAQLDGDSILLSSISMTQACFRDADSESFHKELEPIFASVSAELGFYEDMIWIQEHVEQSAKILFGPDYALTHHSFSKYRYFPEEGVYTPPHTGGGINCIPAVLDVAENGDAVAATVSYAVMGLGGYFELGDFENVIAEEQLIPHLKSQARRFTVSLRKTEDGGLYILSQAQAPAG